jgi:hypothetical protein
MLLTSQVFLASLLCAGFQPEVIAQQECAGGQRDADQHPAAFALFPMRLLGFFRGVLRVLRGGLG